MKNQKYHCRNNSKIKYQNRKKRQIDVPNTYTLPLSFLARYKHINTRGGCYTSSMGPNQSS